MHQTISRNFGNERGSTDHVRASPRGGSARAGGHVTLSRFRPCLSNLTAWVDLIGVKFYRYRTMKKSAVIGALGALAQETRLDIFRLLVEKGPEGMPAGAIGERLGQPSPTLSFHRS